MAQKGFSRKYTSRERKKLRLRKRIRGTGECPRVSVFKSDRYTYVQVISDVDGKTIASASTREKEVMDLVSSLDSDASHSDKVSTKSVKAAHALGKTLAARLGEKNVEKMVFDRNGYPYRGRVSAVADGLRAAGVKI